ncbi:MAG: hypothetical protein HRU14_07205 [Planctomycetes bacterium]|nr:hypothetical protein [Planctomycetota bacterium]
MASVQEAIARLDGVLSVSAGWWTDQAAIRTAAGRELTLEEVDKAVPSPFRGTALTRATDAAN